MNTQKTAEQSEAMKLIGMAKAYKSILATPLQKQPSTHETVAILAETESLFRQQYRSKMYMKLSRLRYDVVPEQIVCSDVRNLAQEDLLQLCECACIRSGSNVLITGPTGVGKSYLACALGRLRGLKGGKARAKSLSFKKRSEIAKKAAATGGGSKVNFYSNRLVS